MEIRRLTPKDAENYWRIRLEALKRNPEAFSTSYEDAIKKENPVKQYIKSFQSEDTFTLGAFENEQMIGVITLLLEKTVKLRHKANIAAMYVSAEKRREGIGKALMKEAIKKAKSFKYIEQINLSVVSSNKIAKGIYLSMGFKVFGTEMRALKHNGDYFDEDLMVLFLR
ncbi:GNAT family N-acetyltransferase [Scopulibacillus cellulosilyticus]|uniref:GNAT family N-acetyltransferase n=1 Tax=Scopulibacillus cellulosilyticus TaxID=2665665 RepID=A0ABW2PPV8_9BACL